MRIEHLDGQQLFFIEDQDVIYILEKGIFDGNKLWHIEYLHEAISEYLNYSGVELALIGSGGRYSLICFVNVDGKKYRVHIENVICEHCGERSGVSGTPGVWDLYFQCSNPKKTWKDAMSLPVKCCKHCNNPLQRRHTIWFENEHRS